ncbi:MAG: hypothetical protein V1772_01965 [Chloroflexota bacterium]
MALRLWNDCQDVALSFSADGAHWTRLERCLEVSTNAAALQLGLYACGQGEAAFRDFGYHGLD